jgi:hypothetical protein
MPRKKPITLAQVDKARASFLCLLRDVKGRREKERHGQNLRRAISARAKWLRLKLAYEAQEFTPARAQAWRPKAAPRAAGTPSGGLQGLRPAGIIVDGLPQGFHSIHIHQGNTGKSVKQILQDLAFDAGSGADFDLAAVEAKIRSSIGAAAVNWPLIGALSRAAHALETGASLRPCQRLALAKGLRAAVSELSRSPGRAE